MLDDSRVAESVVHIDQDRNRGVSARKLLNADDSSGEIHASTAILLRNLNAHETLLKQLLDNSRIHLLSLVHVTRARKNHICGKLGDGVNHGGFELREVGDGCRRDLGDVDMFIAARCCCREGTSSVAEAKG